MKLRMLKTCILEPGITAVQGQVLESVPDAVGAELVSRGLAEIWEPLRNPVPMPRMEFREPEVEHRDPKPERTPKRSRRKHA